MLTFNRLAAPALLAVWLAAPALGQTALTGMVTGTDIDRIQQIAQTYGTVERRQDDQGTWLRGSMDDTIYTISFLNCDDAHENCTSVQLRAWWQSNGAHSIEDMNQWNRDRRFSAAYLDSDNNATIEWDLNLAGGVTAVNFDDSLQWWQAVLRQFRETVIDPGYAAHPGSAPSTTPRPGK